MKILVVGGTRFVGRHLVARLCELGHDLTLLNRGVTDPALFPNLPRVQVDRSSSELGQASGLKQEWDAVVDLSAYFPADVRRLLGVLNGRMGRYVLCSTISVYQDSAAGTLEDGPIPWIDEEAGLQDCSPAQAVDLSMVSYGARKAECERVAREFCAAPVVILRPSLVFGPHDPTDRFAYWIWRAASDQRFLLPDDGLGITRRTYAPDLAQAFAGAVTQSAAAGQSYNIAESRALSFRQTLVALGRQLGRDPLERAVRVSSQELLAAGVRSWSDLPLWLPHSHLLLDNFKMRRDLGVLETPPERALAVAADAFLALGVPPKAGLSEEAEARLIERLTARHSGCTI